MDKVYFYGMRLRPFGPGCQPNKGFLDVTEDQHDQGYHNILLYERKLSEKEISNYELDFLEELDWKETYKKWTKLIKKEYAAVDIELVDEYIDKALREGIRDITIVMEWIQCETGLVSKSEQERLGGIKC